MVLVGVLTAVAGCGWSGPKWQAPNKVCSNIKAGVIEPMVDLNIRV